MIPRKSGAILIVGSTSMFTPGPTEVVYRISKYGLRPIMQSMAIELAPHNIRCNLLIPGYYRTRLTADIPSQVEDQLMQEIPLGRAGETFECGTAAALLLSDQIGGYITGAELLVDGGVSLRPMFFGNQADLAALNAPPRGEP
jgi:glucose 1-dehydrogenase